MKIAIATDFHSPWIGGPATFIDNFTAYLAGAGHEVHVLAPSATGAPSEETRQGITIHRIGTAPLPFGYNVRGAWRFDQVYAALRRIRPDVMQAHHPFPLSLAAVLASRRLGIPVAAVNHTVPQCSLYGLRGNLAYPIATSAFSRYLRWFLKRAQSVSTPTCTAARLLRDIGIRRHVEIISNGVDTGRFVPAPDKRDARAALHLPNAPLVLYTGRLDPEKDMQTWLRAGAAAVRETAAHLVVGGEGTDKPRLRQLVDRLGIASRVTFPGYLPLKMLPLLYQAADVYCITSAVELQSITTLEALSSGLPVVAADAYALPELVEDGINGALAKPGDSDAFATAMIMLLKSPEQAKAMGLAGRQRAEGHSLAITNSMHEAFLARTSRKSVGRASVRDVPA